MSGELVIRVPFVNNEIGNNVQYDILPNDHDALNTLVLKKSITMNPISEEDANAEEDDKEYAEIEKTLEQVKAVQNKQYEIEPIDEDKKLQSLKKEERELLQQNIAKNKQLKESTAKILLESDLNDKKTVSRAKLEKRLAERNLHRASVNGGTHKRRRVNKKKRKTRNKKRRN